MKQRRDFPRSPKEWLKDLHDERSRDVTAHKLRLKEIDDLPLEEREAAAVWTIRSLHGTLNELARIESLLGVECFTDQVAVIRSILGCKHP